MQGCVLRGTVRYRMIDDAARLVTSINSGSPRATWKVTTLPGLATAYEWGIACTRRLLCVAFDKGFERTSGQSENQRAFVSIDPGGGPGAWRALHLPGFFASTLHETKQMSCPWKGVCVRLRNLAGQPAALIVSARALSKGWSEDRDWPVGSSRQSGLPAHWFPLSARLYLAGCA